MCIGVLLTSSVVSPNQPYLAKHPKQECAAHGLAAVRLRVAVLVLHKVSASHVVQHLQGEHEQEQANHIEGYNGVGANNWRTLVFSRRVFVQRTRYSLFTFGSSIT